MEAAIPLLHDPNQHSHYAYVPNVPHALCAYLTSFVRDSDPNQNSRYVCLPSFPHAPCAYIVRLVHRANFQFVCLQLCVCLYVGIFVLVCMFFTTPCSPAPTMCQSV